MKKTINTNLGGFVFHIDEDGYLRLEKYLEALKQSLIMPMNSKKLFKI
jgi:hypothetical protein